MFISIDKRKHRSYANQIYDAFRNNILSGDLEEGASLPSTRNLSRELSVARNTVLTAYDMLSADGFVQSLPGSGIYVKHGVKAVRQPIQVMDYHTASLTDDQMLQNIVSFDSGIPALDLFPRNKWITTASQSFRDAPASALGYDDPQGRPELRSVLASYLKKSRGIDCTPGQLLITSGAKQGLTLVAKCLLNCDSEVWLEDPSNRNVQTIFSYHTDHITPIPVDGEGIMTSQLPNDKNPSLIFVTPSHQFPMGGILSIQRRLELIQCARKSDCWLVEDDYDSEFRYDGTPVKSLHELDPDHVIYIGTFSKILFPSLRLGYIVLPSILMPQFREWKRLSDHHSNSISQLALMRFIESGNLEIHIKHMKKIYHKRRDLLLELLPRYFSNQYRILGDASGMHILLELHGVDFTTKLVQRIKENGVYVVPIEDHSIIKGKHLNQIILGYAHLSPEEMEQGLSIIKRSIEQYT